MATKNNYVPEYMSFNLPWYERDGLMTWFDQRKCEEFLRDSEKHFKDTKIVNFDFIYREIRGEKVPKDLLKKYQTVTEERTKKYPKEKQNEFLSHAFRAERPDIYFDKKIIHNHFKCK